MAIRVLLDANVLWSPQQRNLVLQVAYQDVVDVFWTRRIVEEWLRNLDAEQRGKCKARTVPLMERHFPDALLPEMEESAIGETHSGDRHVASAAASIAPSMLLTWNIPHFDRKALGARSVELKTPDELLASLIDANPAYLAEIARAAQTNLTKSAPRWDDYLNVLRRNGLVAFVDRLRALSPSDDPGEGGGAAKHP